MRWRGVLVVSLSTRLSVVLGLVVADVATKLWAFGSLPKAADVALDGRGPDFVVTLNETGVVLGAVGAELYSANETFVMAVGFGLLALSAFALALSRTALWPRVAWLSVPVGLTLVSGLAQWAQRSVRPIGVDPGVLVAAMRLCAMAPLVVGVTIARDRLVTAGIVLVLAGAVANGVSFFYPPYAPIDFIRVDLADSAVVLNVADLYVALGVVVLLAAPPAAAGRTLLRRLRPARVSAPDSAA